MNNFLTGLNLSVNCDGVVSLWDDPAAAQRGAQPGEVLVKLYLNEAQLKQLVNAQDEARTRSQFRIEGN